MNPKIKSVLRSILMALVTVFGFIGLGKYVPALEFGLENLDSVWDAVIVLFEFVIAFIAFFKDSDNAVKGQMVRKEFKNKVGKLSEVADKRQAFFDYKS